MNDISTKVRNDTHSLLVYRRMCSIGKSRLMMMQRYVVASNEVKHEANNMLMNCAINASFRQHFNILVSGIDKFSTDICSILSRNRDKITCCDPDNAYYYLINPNDVDVARDSLLQCVQHFFREVIENIRTVDTTYSKPKIMSFYYCYVTYLVMMVESLAFVSIVSRIYNNMITKDPSTRMLVCQEVQSYILMHDSVVRNINTSSVYERQLKHLFNT